MEVSKQQNVTLMLLSGGMAWASLFILIDALKDDNMLRTVLASVGFLGLGGLFAAMVITRIKAAKA